MRAGHPGRTRWGILLAASATERATSMVGDLTSAEGTYLRAQGLIQSEWVKQDDRFDLTVEIPPNTSAEVWVPRVYRNEHVGPKHPRAELLRTEDDYTVYRVGSGVHRFASAGPPLDG